MSSVRTLDRTIRERHLLNHPFYVAWGRGEVPLATLRDYAAQYYQFESNFPRYVAGAYARLRDSVSRRTLLDNLVDEEGRSPTHPELWLQFARALGASPRAVRNASAAPATSRLLDTYETFALNGSAAAGLGALYAYESIFPEVAAEKSRGLRAHYGIRERAAHEFFRVHTFADKAHAAAERRLLAREIAQSPVSASEATRAVDATVDAWWGFLDAFQVTMAPTAGA
jgi:pyrroloquinoline-quinone synthase